MRRFITSLAGKVFSHLVIASLLASYLSLAFSTRAEAQVQTLPLWAVTEFTVHGGLSQTYGQIAATNINAELSSTSRYQMVGPSQVDIKIKALNLDSPLQGTNNLLRVGQELKASVIVNGDVIAAEVRSVGGGKQARVALRAVAYNVASGLPVNGSAVEGDSTVRNGSVTDDELIKDAIRAGASTAIREFQQHQLPSATVLNTLTDRCYFNAGSRAGFTGGQEVVITRGREEVATGHVTDLQPDEAVIIIERSYLGVAPGDHVSAIFPIPDVAFDAPFARNSTSLHTNRSSKIGNNATLISLLVIAGLVGVLLGNGGNTQDVLNSVTAQSVLTDGGPVVDDLAGTTPGVLVSWSANGYAKGNSEIAAWQIYRSDYPNAPVAVTQGSSSPKNVVDTFYAASTTAPYLQYQNWTYLEGVIGGTQCNLYGSYDDEANPGNIPSVVPGQTYVYQVELVYALSSIDLPIATSGSGGSTGSTSTSTSSSSTSTSTSTGTTTSTSSTSTGVTTGGTTGTTTGTTTGSTSTSTTTGSTSTSTTSGSTSTSGSTGSTSTSGATICYFLSPKQSSGPATPIYPPTVTPITQPIAAGAKTSFSFFGSSRTQPLKINYVLQFSLSSNFTNNKSQTFDYPTLITELGTGAAGTGSQYTVPALTVFGSNSFLPSAFQAAPTVFWRVGARVATDSPGPLPDPYTHERYIFSQPSFFTFQSGVPTNPTVKHKTGSRHRKA